MALPLVSIVIPVCNGSNYLREAVDSALAQTYPHFEVLVVNDGSDDGGATDAIALSYGSKIRYFCKSNGGVASALNLALLEMHGDFFSWLSHDDIYMPYKLERQIAFLDKLESKDVLLFSDSMIIDSEGKPLAYKKLPAMLMKKKPLLAFYLNLLSGCTMLIPRKALLSVGGFRDLYYTQDYDCWWRLRSKLPFVHQPEITLQTRYHINQGYLKPEAGLACDTFWLKVFEDLTDDEISALYERTDKFWLDMAEWTHRAGFYTARDFAVKKTGTKGKIKIMQLQLQQGIWSFVKFSLQKARLLEFFRELKRKIHINKYERG